jgi:hypothetical protein
MHNLVSCDLSEQLLADGKVQIIQLGLWKVQVPHQINSVKGEKLTKTGLRNLGLQSAPRKERIFFALPQKTRMLAS